MKRLITHVLTALGCIALVAAVGLWSAPKLIAAVKAALVQNVDEPGRNPYQESVSNINGCPRTFCVMDFTPVPAGKRLVVKSITTFFGNDAGGNSQFVSLYAAQSRQFEQFFATKSCGPDNYSVRENILAYYEAGFQPRVELHSDTNIEGGIQATLTGYYINLP